MSFECPRCNRVSHHPEDERHGYCGNCHDFTGKPADAPTGINIIVNGIVAARNGQPYVQLMTDRRMVAQFTIAEARSVALDLMRSASYAETDAMLHGFFEKMGLPQAALAGLLYEFRDFRFKLDTARVETRHSDPDTGEEKP